MQRSGALFPAWPFLPGMRDMQYSVASRRSQSESKLQSALDAVLQHSLKSVSLGVGILYALLALGHYWVLPSAASEIMTPVAGVTSAVFFVLRWSLRSWEPPVRWAHPLGLAIVMVCLGNSLLHLYVLDDPGQTTNQMLIVIGASYLFLSLYYVLSTIASVWVGWAVIASYASPDVEWQHYGFALLSTTIIGLIMHVVRTRTLRRLEQLRMQNERHKDELEQRVVERTKQLQGSLDEQHVLLREVHHRVKNNLQVVCSLLDLELRAEPDAAVSTILVESRGRILTMALVHENLYQADELSHIDMNIYFRHMVADVFNAHGEWPQEVSLQIDADAVQLDIDRAVPCGLVVHELVANALRHGFPDDRKGHLRIALRASGDQVTLEVNDDGVGLPASFDLRRCSSLGMQLVRVLSRQLRGEPILNSEGGTQFALTFPR